jgi:GTP cyclohydrolase I
VRGSKSFDKEKIKKAIIDILEAIGENPNRPGLKGTPERVANMYEELLGGDKSKSAELLSKTHELEHDEMVILKDIPFYSMCEHHMIPFFGTCSIAYIPQHKKIVGISKLSRVVDLFSKQLQVQERFTTEIAEAIMQNLDPKGAAVVVKARHMCMEMRGIKRPGTYTITSVVRGIFMRNSKTREEFLRLIE